MFLLIFSIDLANACPSERQRTEKQRPILNNGRIIDKVYSMEGMGYAGDVNPAAKRKKESQAELEALCARSSSL